jgi:hypothetical protein
MSSSQDPLAIYRIKGIPSSISQPINEQNESASEEDALSKYRVTKPSAENEFSKEDILRVPAGLAARGLETTIGAPEALRKTAGMVLDTIIGIPAEYISGKKLPNLRETLKNPQKALSYTPAGYLLDKVANDTGLSDYMKLPSSEDVKENVTKPLSKLATGNENILEPKNEKERFAQDFTQDLVSLSIPGSGVQSWLARTGLSLAGNSAKQIAKNYGFSPTTQELSKLGTLGVLSLSNIGNAPQFARQLFQQVKQEIPRGIRISTQPLQRALNNIRASDWFRGHNTPSTNAAREMITAIEQRIQNGTLPIHDAMTLRENINELANNLGAFAVERTGRGPHVAHLNEVRDALIQGMEQTVGRTHPTWWTNYQAANTAFGITQRSSALGNFIANNYGKPIVSEAGKILFGNALAKGAAGVAKIGMAGVGIATGVKAIELTNRIARSPVLRRYYIQVLNCSVRSDGLAMAKALEKFDQEAQKEEKSDKIIKSLRNPYQK